VVEVSAVVGSDWVVRLPLCPHPAARIASGSTATVSMRVIKVAPVLSGVRGNLPPTANRVHPTVRGNPADLVFYRTRTLRQVTQPSSFSYSEMSTVSNR